ncbi:hypothetical protein L195_g057033, partial [Trifolium pratense]
TYQCVVFRDLVQKALNEGRLKYDDKAKPPMKVDTDPLPTADATYVKVYDCNMVEVVDAAAQIEVVPEEEYERRVREVYPNAEEELVDFLNRCKLKNSEVMLCVIKRLLQAFEALCPMLKAKENGQKISLTKKLGHTKELIWESLLPKASRFSRG